MANGRVVRVGVKRETPGERGLPKPSVPSAQVTPSGLEGDFNRYRHEEIHDDPDSAVLLMPCETLEEIARDGWPVSPGDFGENLTTAGVPYECLRAGRRVRVGPVELVLTRPCDPCSNLYLLPYVGAERGPAFLKATLGRRGWYARVARGGPVRVGDRVEISG